MADACSCLQILIEPGAAACRSASLVPLRWILVNRSSSHTSPAGYELRQVSGPDLGASRPGVCLPAVPPGYTLEVYLEVAAPPSPGQVMQAFALFAPGVEEPVRGLQLTAELLVEPSIDLAVVASPSDQVCKPASLVPLRWFLVNAGLAETPAGVELRQVAGPDLGASSLSMHLPPVPPGCMVEVYLEVIAPSKAEQVRQDFALFVGAERQAQVEGLLLEAQFSVADAPGNERTSSTSSSRPHFLCGLRPGDHTRMYRKRRAAGVPAAAEPALVLRAPEEEDSEWSVLSAQGKALEFKAPAAFSRAGTSVTFIVNGEKHTVESGSLPIATSLAEYLRDHTSLTGTKIGCGEGGCGACTVVLKDAGRSHVCNSCLRPVWSLDGMEVLTTEGLGSTGRGLHKVQDAVAKCNGTQCGMCTPGMVMAIFGYLSKGQDHQKVEDVETCIQGNLCRCTGYRPIYKAIHGLAEDAAKADAAAECSGRKPKPKTAADVKPKPKSAYPKQAQFIARDQSSVWMNCTTLADVFSALKACGSEPYRLVVGNTSTGVIKYYPPHPSDSPKFFINVRGVEELKRISVTEDAISFGAAVTLSEVIEHLQGISAKVPGFTAVIKHLKLVAHPQVRDVASWAGNVMMAKTHKDFPSDVCLLFTLLQARLSVSDGQKTGVVLVEDFLSGADLRSGHVLTEVTLPFPKGGDVVKSFKVMRRHANAHAEVNAGFHFTFGSQGKISSLRVVLGNIRQGPLVCKKTAAAAAGQELSLGNFRTAVYALASEVKVMDPSVEDPPFAVADPKYRSDLAQSLFYKAWLGAMVEKLGPASVPEKLRSAAVEYERPPSGGTQTFTQDPGEAPVGDALEKLEGPAQASGEAAFTGDLPWPEGTCVGHVVVADRVGKISLIDAAAALQVDGVVAFISADTVKSVGASNVMSGTPYQIFATGVTKHVGQIVGLVCASTAAAAAEGAAAVSVHYEASALTASPTEPQILPDPDPIELSQASESLHAPRITTGQMSLQGQKHFYMETQVTLAVPDAQGGLVVNTAAQCFDTAKTCLTQTLNLPAEKVVVQNARVGGAYGGKAMLYAPVAGAACVAALSLKRPVLLQLDRNNDFLGLGSRPPSQATWSVGFDEHGRIDSLETTVTVDAGFDKSGGIPATSLAAYNVPHAKLSTKTAITAKPANTIMRSPGEFDGCVYMEAIIEQIARRLNLDPTAVQETNMLPEVKDIWSALKPKYDEKRKEVDVFNLANRWRKRGVYLQPCLFFQGKAVDYTGFSEKCMVRVEANGAVALDHSGLECGQGLNTKVVQAAAREFLKVASDFDIALLQTVVPKSTARFSWSGITPTWGSGTSEACAAAASRACAAIAERLAKYTTHQTWAAKVAAAIADGVDLSSTGVHEASEGIKGYDIAIAALVSAEIDVLTGETQVLSVDIRQDCGKSLNPAIDIGQIEGCFVQALGFCLTETLLWSKKDSRLVNNGTWDYKVPSPLDAPIEMNVTLPPGDNSTKGNVMGSKATGEPTMCVGAVTFFAVKDAIYAARQEATLEGYFPLDTPASVDAIQQMCAVAF